MAAPDLGRLRTLRARLCERVIGQEEAMAALADALLAGELGHTPPGRPRSILLLLGPTGTGKTKAILEAAGHLHGPEAVARIDAAEFPTPDRVPLLLGTAEGGRGLLGPAIDRLRASGGRILLIDEIEKADRSVSDLLLGIEAGRATLASGETLDFSGLHVIATSNLGSSDAAGLEGVARASIRRHVEQEAAAHFRPEVFARFTGVIVFMPLSRDTQLGICRQILDDEVRFQAEALATAFGHPHRIRIGPGVHRRLMAEGFHRRLGARPMRGVVERRVRSAVVAARLRGGLLPGVRESALVLDESGGLRAAALRGPIRVRLR